MIIISSSVSKCDSCGSKRDTKAIGACNMVIGQVKTANLCPNCRETLKEMLIDDAIDEDEGN